MSEFEGLPATRSEVCKCLMMLILVDHAFMMLKDAWDSNLLGDNQGTIRGQNANARNQTKTKREIANGQSFASKRVSLSTFWTRKPKFEVFRQTCSGTISGQFRNNKIKTKIAFSTKTTNFRISEILYYTLHFIRDSLLHASFYQRQ